MLTLAIKPITHFDEETSSFVEEGSEEILQLEHSLVSVSKWEEIWKKPFLTPTKKTPEETRSYIECMILNEVYSKDIVSKLSKDQLDQINTYIADDMTATTFNEEAKKSSGRETLTAELIYYWLTAATIPFECQHWHLNKLFTLLRIASIKSQPPKKNRMGRREALNQQRLLNEQRKAQYGTEG